MYICTRVGVLFVVFAPSNIYGDIRVGTDMWQCALTVSLKCCPTRRPGHQHHNLISQSVTFFWHSANQTLLYANNAETPGQEATNIYFKVIGLTRPGFEITSANPPNLPKRETGLSTHSDPICPHEEACDNPPDWVAPGHSPAMVRTWLVFVEHSLSAAPSKLPRYSCAIKARVV